MSKFISSIFGPSLHITMQCCVTVVGLFLGHVSASDCVSLGAHTHTHMHAHMYTQCFLVWLIWFTYALVLIVLYTPGFHTGYFAGGGWFVFDLQRGVRDLQDIVHVYKYQAVFHLHTLQKNMTAQSGSIWQHSLYIMQYCSVV